jgi:predicted permease
LAFWSIDVLVPFAARFTTLSSELRVGPEVVAFCVLVSIGCGLVIGLLPSIGLRQTPLFTAQMESSNLTARIGSRTRGLLVAAQLAVSVVLLVGAGLTLRTLLHLEKTDGGFRPSGVVTARIYLLNPSTRKFYDGLLQRTGNLYGVDSVAIASTFPLSTRGEDRDNIIEVSAHGATASGTTSTRAVSEDYFRTIGVPLISGRNFAVEDDAQHPLVVIINQQMARHYWPNGNAVGQTITFNRDDRATVIGVVGNVKQRGLDKDPIDEAYCAFAQTHAAFMSVVLRSSRSATELAPELSWIVHDLDPDAVITDVQSLSEVRENSLIPRRNTAWFFSLFAALALAITASGISGLMALEVTERKHEIGIRLALGATPGRVMNTMMARVMAIVLGGLGFGVLIAWLMSSSMQKLIYGIVPRDSVTFAVSSIVLVVIAASSSFLPLTRIARLDPTVLLKVEG